MTEEINKQVTKRFCLCGCGQEVTKNFKRGHVFNIHPDKRFRFGRGQNHYGWVGGRLKHPKGYIWIYSPLHPYKDKRGYVLEHRLVMEDILGRHLNPSEIVHHVNEIKSDNRPENLELMSKIEHNTHHRLRNKIIINRKKKRNIDLEIRYWRPRIRCLFGQRYSKTI